MKHMKVDYSVNPMGEDVFDLPDEDRESLHENEHSRDTFRAAGMDDYMPVDKVIAGNGEAYFVTQL